MVIAKYLLDTDWAVYYLRGKTLFVNSIDQFQREGLAISIISIAEYFMRGFIGSSNPEKKEIALLNFLEGLRIFSFTKPVARIFGQKRAKFRNMGFTIGDMDLLIACIAEYHSLTILTNNRKHFERVPGNIELFSLSS